MYTRTLCATFTYMPIYPDCKAKVFARRKWLSTLFSTSIILKMAFEGNLLVTRTLSETELSFLLNPPTSLIRMNISSRLAYHLKAFTIKCLTKICLQCSQCYIWPKYFVVFSPSRKNCCH